MKCPECGKEVDDKKWFCNGCKAPLHLDEEIFVPEVEARAGEKESDYASSGARGGSGGSEARPNETPAKPEFMFHGRLRKSWLIRILITVLIIAILIGALLLIAYSRKAKGQVASRSESAVGSAGGHPQRRVSVSAAITIAIMNTPYATSPVNCFALT